MVPGCSLLGRAHVQDVSLDSYNSGTFYIGGDYLHTFLEKNPRVTLEMVLDAVGESRDTHELEQEALKDLADRVEASAAAEEFEPEPEPEPLDTLAELGKRRFERELEDIQNGATEARRWASMNCASIEPPIRHGSPQGGYTPSDPAENERRTRRRVAKMMETEEDALAHLPHAVAELNEAIQEAEDLGFLSPGQVKKLALAASLPKTSA